MIDNIRFTKKNLTDSEVKNIIKKSYLQPMFEAKTGKVFYATGIERQLYGGMYIKINVDNSLTIRGSLHKYYSFLTTGKNTNFGSFTMEQAKDTFLKFIENKGIDPINLKIGRYEVGLNLIFDFDVVNILESAYSIGKDKTKEVHIEPNFRQKRFKTSERSPNIRVSYKLYDKVFQMKETRNPPPKENHILRIETTQRKLLNTFSLNFFTDNNLHKIQEKFFNKWDNLNLKPSINAPKGTHESKIDLVKEIYKNAPIPTLEKYNKQREEGTITIKIHRKIREFINDWNKHKHTYKLAKSPIGRKWADVYEFEKQQYNKKHLQGMTRIDKNIKLNG
jgi:hypothetical protein